MKITFKKGEWEDKFVYAYSYRFDAAPVFVQEEDHIRNRTTESEIFAKFPFENVSMMIPKKLKKETKITLTCSFDSFGAPLIILSDDLTKDAKGNYKYGNYYEVVLYENGINVWKLNCSETEIKYHLVLGNEYQVPAGTKQTFTVYCEENHLMMDHDGHHMKLYLPDMAEEYYFGVDACENINRFYEIAVEE